MSTDPSTKTTGKGTHVVITLSAEQLAIIDALRGTIPRATLVRDLAMRAAAAR